MSGRIHAFVQAMGWLTQMKWTRRNDEAPEPQPPRAPPHGLVDVVDEIPELDEGSRPVLIHALEGFLSAGSAGRLAGQHLTKGSGRVIASFDIDSMFDYRARRPGMVFDKDHYAKYDSPRLVVKLMHDEDGTPYLLLTGPEPDFYWEGFSEAVRTLVDRLDVSMMVGLGAVPMGVPHTRPVVITMHGTKPELIDRQNLWSGELVVPASAQSLMEFRLGQWGYDAVGFVAHVPHYLGQVEFPSAAVALLEAVATKTGLSFELDSLRTDAVKALSEIDEQVQGQDGGQVVSTLEEQYDMFTRGTGESLLASQGPLPSADELGAQVEDFLAQLDPREDRD